MSDLALQRRFFAEEVQITSNIKSAALVEALATVARERFLPPGPWTIRGEADFQSGPRQTPDADPRHVYHNLAIAIDPARMLFNGSPGLIALAIDSLGIKAGDCVLHIGTGNGYYTAIIAEVVGPNARVVGVEVDAALAAFASRQLDSTPWVEIRHADGSGPLGETFDAILINAGVTHPLATWLDGLAPGGRMILPLTAAMPGPPGPMSAIGKGLLLLITRADDSDHFAVRPVTFVAIYSALGVRDGALNADIGKALMKHPFPPVRTLRRDAHEKGPACWLHGDGFCLQLGEKPQG